MKWHQPVWSGLRPVMSPGGVLVSHQFMYGGMWTSDAQHLKLSWARWAVGEAQFDQSASQVMP